VTAQREPIRAVLLDLYDTLVWSEWPAMRAELEERFGLGEADLIRAFVATRPLRSVGTYGSAEGDLRAILDAAGLEIPDEDLRSLSEERIAGFLSHGVHLWDDSIPTIRALRERGVRTAVVSNCDHSTRPVVERLGLVEETDAMILSFEVGAAKPDPEIYEAALRALGVGAAESVFVDDQASYCEGALALGIRSLLILREDAAPAEGVSEPGGFEVIRGLDEVLALVDATAPPATAGA
jgi:putative hydrolase of the HAD superfamily